MLDLVEKDVAVELVQHFVVESAVDLILHQQESYSSEMNHPLLMSNCLATDPVVVAVAVAVAEQPLQLVDANCSFDFVLVAGK